MTTWIRLTLFVVDGETLTRVAEVPIGKLAGGLAFSRGSKTILAQSMCARTIAVLRWDGPRVGTPLVITDAVPEMFATAWP